MKREYVKPVKIKDLYANKKHSQWQYVITPEIYERLKDLTVTFTDKLHNHKSMKNERGKFINQEKMKEYIAEFNDFVKEVGYNENSKSLGSAERLMSRYASDFPNEYKDVVGSVSFNSEAPSDFKERLLRTIEHQQLRKIENKKKKDDLAYNLLQAEDDKKRDTQQKPRRVLPRSILTPGILSLENIDPNIVGANDESRKKAQITDLFLTTTINALAHPKQDLGKDFKRYVSDKKPLKTLYKNRDKAYNLKKNLGEQEIPLEDLSAKYETPPLKEQITEYKKPVLKERNTQYKKTPLQELINEYKETPSLDKSAIVNTLINAVDQDANPVNFKELKNNFKTSIKDRLSKTNEAFDKYIEKDAPAIAAELTKKFKQGGARYHSSEQTLLNRLIEDANKQRRDMFSKLEEEQDEKAAHYANLALDREKGKSAEKSNIYKSAGEAAANKLNIKNTLTQQERREEIEDEDIKNTLAQQDRREEIEDINLKHYFENKNRSDKIEDIKIKNDLEQIKRQERVENINIKNILGQQKRREEIEDEDLLKRSLADYKSSKQAEKDAKIEENDRSRLEKLHELSMAQQIISGNPKAIDILPPRTVNPAMHKYSQASYNPVVYGNQGNSVLTGIGGAIAGGGTQLAQWGNKSNNPSWMQQAKGGRVHKANGGVLREAIDNAYLNHISSLQSLNNLERANLLENRDKKAEGGSPIDKGARIADKYAQQVKRETLAKKLESPEEKGLLELLARGFFKGARDSGSNFLGAAPHAITAGFEENDKAEQAQLQKQLKAEELQSQFSKELQHEEEVAEAIRQKEQDHALHLRKQAHDEAYQGQHLAQMREDKMERYLADKDYRQEKLAKEDRAYELAKQKFEHELSPESKAAVKSMEKQIDARNVKILQLESAPTGGIMGKLNTGFGLFDDRPGQIKKLKDEVNALEKERMRVIGGTHTKDHDLTTTNAASVSAPINAAKNPLKGDGGMLYKSFLDKRAKYAGGRVG